MGLRHTLRPAICVVVLLSAVMHTQARVSLDEGLANRLNPAPDSLAYTISSSSPGNVLQQDCPSEGQITAVWCREDSAGALQDITYLNSATGLQSTSCSGQQGSDSGSSYSKAMFLEEGEVIVSVKACSLNRDGYTSVTFVTDGDQQLTCGSSKARREDGNRGGSGAQAVKDAAQALLSTLNNTVVQGSDGDRVRLQFVDHTTSNGEVLAQHGLTSAQDNKEGQEGGQQVSRALLAASRRSKRHHGGRDASRSDSKRYVSEKEKEVEIMRQKEILTILRARRTPVPGTAARSLLAGSQLADANATAVQPATWWWFDWGHGHNDDEPDSGCQLYTPDHVPEWASASSRKKTGEPFHSFVQGGSGADAYLEFGSKHYYKDAATYEQRLAEFRSDRKALGSSAQIEPAWFWDQVEPLAGITLQCTGSLASGVGQLCWNRHHSPPPAPWGVPSKVSLNFEEGITCPRTPQQVLDLQAQLSRFSQQLAAGSGGVLGGIVWGRYTPANCQVDSSGGSVLAQVPGNVTITLQATFLPANGHFIFSVAHWLRSLAPQDLCEVTSNGGQSACFNTDIAGATQMITIVFGEGVSKEQQMQAIEKLQAEHDSVLGLMKQQQQQDQEQRQQGKKMAAMTEAEQVASP